MEYRGLVREFMAAKFPSATVAVLAGSTARGTRTATSDIDLLVLGDDLFSNSQTSLAATYDFGDEVFEVFAYTLESFGEWARKGIAEYRPVIVEMLLEGVEVRGGSELANLREFWGPLFIAGPNPAVHDLDMRRYVITDLLDDLQDSTDQLEQRVIASALFSNIAELLLITNHRWIGAGKHLPRRLREFSVETARQLSVPLLSGDFDRFGAEVERWLETSGGRVHAGFVR